MNLPVRLARSDCAYNNLTVLFKSRFFMLSDSLRAAYYDLSLKLIDVVISNLTYIQNESDGKSAEDPCLPTLKTIRKILEVLKESAETSLEMATSERGIESFGGPLAIAKIRLVDPAVMIRILQPRIGNPIKADLAVLIGNVKIAVFPESASPAV